MASIPRNPSVPDGARPTESLCPVCLSAVSALLRIEGDEVSLEGSCPDHGSWRSVVWRGPPSLEAWCGADGPATAEPGSSEGGHRGDRPGPCPGSCGLCPRHEQRTCTAVLEVTRRCDLNCSVCFAESQTGAGAAAAADPPPEQLGATLRWLFSEQGPVNVQLSGGEPTVRDDLPDIIAAARAAGFTFVQLNTNGLRLASEKGYAERLSDAGLVSVFLQFDGLSDDVYRSLRGGALLAQKRRALENCARAGLGVVLVPTVVPGVNDHELGALVRFLSRWPGVVRGLHLQPVSYFGRYPRGDRRRLSLPEVLRALERQTEGQVRAGDFAPSCCEHQRCSFRARYWVRDTGRLEVVSSAQSCCVPEPGGAARQATAATARQWGRPLPTRGAGAIDEKTRPHDDLDRFLESAGRIVSISGMLFQDAWSTDLQRVRRCCVHAVVPGRRLVPFCLWNLTSESGQRLYPRC
jgi:tetraether lipid synthase